MQLSTDKTPPKAFSFDWDLFEKIVVVLLLGGLAMRLVPNALATGHYQNWLLLVAESCVVVFVLLRHPTTNISRRPMDWILGFCGTFTGLLMAPSSDSPLVPLALCSFVMMLGIYLQLAAKFTLRRSFGVIAANRGVKASGPYRFVRHPMYAGYALTHIGFLLSGPTLWNILVCGLTLGLNVGRIVAEERMLLNDPAYQALSTKVRYRLFPYVF